MNLPWIRNALKNGPKDLRLIGLLALIGAFPFDESKDATPSVSEIAEAAGCSYRQAERLIGELEKLGYLTVERRTGQTSRYHWVPLTPMSGVIESKGVTSLSGVGVTSLSGVPLTPMSPLSTKQKKDRNKGRGKTRARGAPPPVALVASLDGPKNPDEEIAMFSGWILEALRERPNPQNLEKVEFEILDLMRQGGSTAFQASLDVMERMVLTAATFRLIGQVKTQRTPKNLKAAEDAIEILMTGYERSMEEAVQIVRIERKNHVMSHTTRFEKPKGFAWWVEDGGFIPMELACRG